MVRSIALLVLAFSFQARADWLDQLDLQGSVTLFTGPSLTAHATFENLIGQTQSQLTMEMYHLTDPAVAQSLERAAQRGVKATVILDNGGLKSASSSELARDLKAAGITVVASSPAFSITHSKSMISDGTSAIVSSMNLTDHPETRRDYGVTLSDPAVISEMESVFAADIQNSAAKTNTTPQLSNPNLVWSPVNSAQKLHDLIASAKRSISAVAENVFDDTVLADLKAAAARGVQVRVISPACPMGEKPDRNYTAAEQLKAAGVDARQMPDPATPQTPYQHGKMMVIDDERAYIGSINFSYNSINRARELGIVLNRKDVIAGLDQAFNQDFSVSTLTDSVPSCVSVGE